MLTCFKCNGFCILYISRKRQCGCTISRYTDHILNPLALTFPFGHDFTIRRIVLRLKLSLVKWEVRL